MQRISLCNISKLYYLYVLSQSKCFNYWNATELTFRKCSCRRPQLRGALYMRRAFPLRRVSGVAPYATARLSRFNERRQTHTRCASLLVYAWLRSPRAPRALALIIQERFSPAFRLVFLLSAFTRNCRFSLLRLCASAPLFCSRLSALLFWFCSASRL